VAAQAAATTANATAVLIVDIPGWQQSDGNVYITCSNAALVIAAIPLS
jgi:hypothetical protein